MANSEDVGEFASLVDRGRMFVRASADLPREALEFLGRPVHGRRAPPQGAIPGELAIPGDAAQPLVRVMSYAPEGLDERIVSDVSEVRALIETPDRTVWIDVIGFGDEMMMKGLSDLLGIHALALADVVHVPQRPKAELYDGRLLVITHMAQVSGAGDIKLEQVSFVLGDGWVVSFQERPGVDVFDPVRDRIRHATSRIRRFGDADYLVYALLDAVVDGYFPVLETLGGVVDALEEEVIERPNRATLARIHATRRTLLSLHRIQWRQRDAIATMLRDDESPLSESVRPYLRDAHDHAFQILDSIETYRDMVIGLMDLYLSSASHRMNEVMKTLTIVATVFIPLTFLAGVYGMNFEYMPELRWKAAYPAFWIAIVVIGAGLFAWFRRRGWLGSSD